MMATIEYSSASTEERKVEDLADYAEQKQMSLQEALSGNYAIVGANHDPVHGSYVILADQSQNVEPGLATMELGYSSPSPWTAWTREERVPELRDKIGLRTFFDMKRADATVRGALRLLKTPIQAARWFVEPYDDTALSKSISEFVEENLFCHLSTPWSQVIEDTLLMCDYGYMAFEKVWIAPDSTGDKVKDGKLRLGKLAPRHPMDIREWLWDENGGPDAFIMENISIQGTGNLGNSPVFGTSGIPNAARTGVYNQAAAANQGFVSNPGNPTFDPRAVEIPITKALVFSLEKEAGDLRGISILRSAYKHYFYKDTMYKIDAIQKERHGIGVPIIKMPLGFSAADRALADNLGRNLRTNERAHIVVPMNWEVAFAKLEGQPVDCLKSIEHHDMKIKSNILAPFMDESNVNPDSLDVYYKATRYIANTICDTFNHYLIPQLVGMNFTRGKAPHLRVRRIGEEESLRTLSFAFRNFVGAGAIRPDDPMEKFLRSELDLPQADPETARVLPDPNAPQSQDMQDSGDSQHRGPEGTRKKPLDKKPQDRPVAGTGANSPAPPGSPRVGPPRQANTPPVHAGRRTTGNDTSGG
jgi:hypothetical protein